MRLKMGQYAEAEQVYMALRQHSMLAEKELEMVKRKLDEVGSLRMAELRWVGGAGGLFPWGELWCNGWLRCLTTFLLILSRLTTAH